MSYCSVQYEIRKHFVAAMELQIYWQSLLALVSKVMLEAY